MTFFSQIIFFSVSVDTHSDLESKSREYQKTLMHNLLSSPTNTSWEQNYRNLIQRHAEPKDECQWRGVECENGIVTQFIFAGYMHEKVHIRMRMLPSTIRLLHLEEALIHNGWSAATLPRNLKYAYMLLNVSNRNKADFHRLPRKIEEFFASQQNWYGPIDLRFLPEGLHLFELLGTIHCSPVVDSVHISQNLKRVSIIALEESTAKRLETVRGGRIDARIFKFVNGSKFYDLGDSIYWHFTHGELQGMFTLWLHTDM